MLYLNKISLYFDWFHWIEWSFMHNMQVKRFNAMSFNIERLLLLKKFTTVVAGLQYVCEHMAHGFDIFNKIFWFENTFYPLFQSLLGWWRCMWMLETTMSTCFFPLHFYRSQVAWSLGLVRLTWCVLCLAWLGITITTFYQWHSAYTIYSVTMFS